jgi:hypothetical protein
MTVSYHVLAPSRGLALAEHVNESGQSVDALVAIRQAEAIVKALELAGYEIKPTPLDTAGWDCGRSLGDAGL